MTTRSTATSIRLARFTLTKPIALPAHVAKGQKFNTSASGTLLLHGVTRPVTVTLDARWNGPTIDAVGTAPITLADFGIDAPHTVIADVDDQGLLRVRSPVRTRLTKCSRG